MKNVAKEDILGFVTEEGKIKAMVLIEGQIIKIDYEEIEINRDTFWWMDTCA